MKKIYLLQGFTFFSKTKITNVVENPEYKVEIGTKQSLFHGLIKTKDDIFLEGGIRDLDDSSIINNFKITTEKITFIRLCQNNTALYYSFDRKEGEIWHGHHTDGINKTGTSKMIITEVPESFLKEEID